MHERLDPLDDDTPPEPYPVDVLPERIRTFVQATAACHDVDVALVAGPALAVLSACVQRRAVIEPKPGWHEPLSLWWLGVAQPGERKSACITAAATPLRRQERLLVEETAEQRRQQNEMLRELKGRRDALRKQIDRAVGEDERRTLREELADVTAELADADSPVVPRLLADDATPEALVALLAEQGGRLACVSGEGAALLGNVAGLYSNGGSNLAGLLQAWSGEAIRVDRIGRDALTVEDAAVALALMIQPDRLASLTATSGDLRGQGGLSRFLFAVPSSRVGRHRWNTPPVPGDVDAGWATTVQGLDDRMRRRDEPAVLRLAPEATRIVRDWHDGPLQTRSSLGGDLAHLGDIAGKLHGQAMRLAGILHLVDARDDVVNAATVAAAIALADWHAEHADRALFPPSQTGVLADARHALAWAHRHADDDHTFSQPELQANGRRWRHGGAVQVQTALELLADRGWLRRIPDPPRPQGGRPRLRWQLTPLAVAHLDAEVQRP